MSEIRSTNVRYFHGFFFLLFFFYDINYIIIDLFVIFKAFTYVKKAFANKGLNGTIEVVGDFKHPTKAIINIWNQFFLNLFSF